MSFLSYIQWNVDPEIIRLGAVALRWYGLLFASGFVAGQYIMSNIFKIEGKSEADLDALLVIMILSTIIGARLGHCLFYAPDYYLANPIKILYMWEGGLASHGATIGILTGLWYYTRSRPDQSWLWILDRIVITVALGGCFIRLGNLMNSEIIGLPTEVPWAFVFEKVDQLPRHPAQLYESISCLFLFFFLYFLYMKYKTKTPEGLLFGIFLVVCFGLRFFYEFLKENQEAFEEGMFLNMGQILSIPLVLFGIWVIYRSLNPKVLNSEKVK